MGDIEKIQDGIVAVKENERTRRTPCPNGIPYKGQEAQRSQRLIIGVTFLV
jgi:hypothetical protein